MAPSLDEILAGLPNMVDGERLSHPQLMSLEPLKSGLYRLYRWECEDCGRHSPKYRLLEALERGKNHNDLTHHVRIDIRGGSFPLSEVGKE